jgi:mRNA interferase MazF
VLFIHHFFNNGKFVKTAKNNYNVAYHMLKDFDQWNSMKKKIDLIHQVVNFAERELWWCSIGLNIGSEQHSENSNFSRPVLVLKKFTENIFLGIPVTTKIRFGQFRYRILINEAENDLLLMQMRVFDRKRLVRQIGKIDAHHFKAVNDEVNLLFRVSDGSNLQDLQNKKTKTPDGVFSGTSDVEVSVCGLSISDEIGLSNEFNYLLSRGELS